MMTHSTDPLFGGHGAIPAADKLLAYRYHTLIAIILIAAALRLIGLGHNAIWADEAYSYWFSNQSWNFLWTEVPEFENHPPYYFLLLKAARIVFGGSEAALRLPSAIGSILTVLLMFRAGCLIGRVRLSATEDPAEATARSWMVGLVAAGLTALAATQVSFAQEARPYAFSSLATSIMILGVLGIITAPERQIRWTSCLALATGFVLTSWSHSLGFVPVTLTGLFLLTWWALATGWNMRVFVILLLTTALALVVLVPHILNVIAQLQRDYGDFWIPVPSLKDLAQYTLHVTAFADMPGRTRLGTVIAIVLLSAGVYGLWRLSQHRTGGIWIPIFLVSIPALFWLMVVGYTFLKNPIFLTRTIIFVHPFTLLILAASPWALPKPKQRVALVALMGVFSLLSLTGKSTVLNFPRDFRAYALHIADSDIPDAPILAFPTITGLILEYYDDTRDLGLNIHRQRPEFPPIVNGRRNMSVYPKISQAEAEGFVAELGQPEEFWLVSRLTKRPDPNAYLPAAIAAAGYVEVQGDGIDNPEAGAHFSDIIRYRLDPGS